MARDSAVIDTSAVLAELATWAALESRRLDAFTGRRLATQHFGEGAGQMTAALRRLRKKGASTRDDRDGLIGLVRQLAAMSRHDKARYVHQQLSRLV